MERIFLSGLILRYLIGQADEKNTVNDFKMISDSSEMNWSFQSHLARFIRRFFANPYRKEDTLWLQKLGEDHGIKVKNKLASLRKWIW